MTFLQPFLLFALPLIGLPIVIHLLNRNRHRTVHWGATMFLLRARRMARGMARLRYLLIMAMRMLALAGLIFAVARPMAGGWLGLTTGGAAETTLVLLDRSASMERQGAASRQSHREAALAQLTRLFETLGRNSRIVLLDSASDEPLELTSPDDLQDLPQCQTTETTADIPQLLQRAAEYIGVHQTGRTDVWLCSDLQVGDWDASGGRWDRVRRQLERHEGIRVYLLAYADREAENLSVSVSGVHRRETLDGAELLMDLRITRSGTADRPIDVPLTITIDGARSTETITITGREFVRNGHAIPISQDTTSGWGQVELPEDAGPTDNTFSFVYADAPVQKTLIVADHAESARYLRLACATSADPSQTAAAEVLTPDQIDLIDWSDTAFIVWQAPLPQGDMADLLTEFVDSGRSLLFLPPQQPGNESLFGCGWNDWAPANGRQVSRWRTEADLLAHTRAGAPLPLGEISILQHCRMTNERASVLASLEEGDPLLVRAWSDRGAVWFCSTLPGHQYSTLIDNGVVFYVMLQRALARGTATLGNARQLECGSVTAAASSDWTPLDDQSIQRLLSDRPLRSGLYSQGDTRFALNRPLSEDSDAVVSADTVDALFEGLEYTRVNDSANSQEALASEVWRVFLVLMIIALIAEAALCLPERTESSQAATTKAAASIPAGVPKETVGSAS